MEQNFIIAIDGYSSCGKSTLAKQLAHELNFAYVDSGAMYRAITLHFIKNNIDLNDISAIEEHTNSANLTFKYVDNQNLIFLNEEDVSEEIRMMYVSEKVSQVSPLPVVRKSLVDHQQKIGKTSNIIMDGRDIGTKVFPNAHLKLFMTADPKKRAERRYEELHAKGHATTFDEVYNNLAKRDHDDSTRTESPLVCAQNAIIIDNTDLNIEQQFEMVLKIVSSALAERGIIS